MTWAIAIMLFVTAQRLGELVLARRNTARLLARGAIEVGASHYPLIVAVHASWLVTLWINAPNALVDTRWIAGFAVLQGLRVWVIASLRERWTTRVIILPGVPPVRHGPYRLMAHPNYAIVVLEIAVLPLAFGLTGAAVAFSTINAAVLFWRIRIETRALGQDSMPALTG